MWRFHPSLVVSLIRPSLFQCFRVFPGCSPTCQVRRTASSHDPINHGRNRGGKHYHHFLHTLTGVTTTARQDKGHIEVTSAGDYSAGSDNHDVLLTWALCELGIGWSTNGASGTAHSRRPMRYQELRIPSCLKQARLDLFEGLRRVLPQSDLYDSNTEAARGCSLGALTPKQMGSCRFPEGI